MWGKRKDVIGLDIGCSSIKLVELKEDKNGYKLQNLAISPLPPEAIVDGALMDSVTIIDTIREAIAASKNTNLAVVAPGIAEALFATALGLLAAIPAVIFYNKFTGDLDRFGDRLDTFSDEVAARLSRRLSERG